MTTWRFGLVLAAAVAAGLAAQGRLAADGEERPVVLEVALPGEGRFQLLSRRGEGRVRALDRHTGRLYTLDPSAGEASVLDPGAGVLLRRKLNARRLTRSSPDFSWPRLTDGAGEPSRYQAVDADALGGPGVAVFDARSGQLLVLRDGAGEVVTYDLVAGERAVQELHVSSGVVFDLSGDR